METKTFHWADYVVFSAVLFISAAIGIYYGIKSRRKSSAEEFLLAGRSLHALPVAMSLQASFLSAVFVLGIPAEVYFYGTMYGVIAIGYLLGYPLSALIFLPVFHRLESTSAYEYFERRFNKVIRSLASLTFILMTVLYMAVALYAPAIAFSQVTGLSLVVTLAGTGIVCTFYTVIGGMKAVVWTDTFQMLVILAGLIALVVQGCIVMGGIEAVWNTATQNNRIDFSNVDLIPTTRTTYWSHGIGGAFLCATLYGANQTMIQRYLSIRSTREAQRAVYISMVAAIVCLVLAILVGLVMYSYYANCDPLKSNRVEKADQMVPLFMMDMLGHLHGLPGLFTACTFSAALSTVSSGVNSLAAVILEDIIKPLHVLCAKEEIKARTATHICRGLALVFGLTTIGLGYSAQFLGDTVIQIALSIFGMAGGPLLGLVTLAMLFRCANKWGAGVGLICSLAVSFWVGLGAIFYPGPKPLLPVSVANCTFNVTTALYEPSTAAILLSTDALHNEQQTSNPLQSLYNLSYMWYSTLAVLVVVLVGLPISLLTGGSTAAVDPDLLCNWSPCCHGKSTKDPEIYYFTEKKKMEKESTAVTHNYKKHLDKLQQHDDNIRFNQQHPTYYNNQGFQKDV